MSCHNVCIQRFLALLAREHDVPTLAAPETIQRALESLPTSIADKGLGADESLAFVDRIVLPALAAGHAGPR